MHRRRLWELDCASLDAVLWTSFAWEELKALADREGLRAPCPHAGSDGGTGAVTHSLHRACHEPNPFSHRVEATLNETHPEAMERVAATEPADLADWTALEFGALPVPLPGLVWALATDPRDGVRTIEDRLVWMVQTSGIRALVFGKVEVIPI